MLGLMLGTAIIASALATGDATGASVRVGRFRMTNAIVSLSVGNKRVTVPIDDIEVARQNNDIAKRRVLSASKPNCWRSATAARMRDPISPPASSGMVTLTPPVACPPRSRT